MHILFIGFKKEKETYNIDFEEYVFTDNVLFFLSPGQVFTVESEQIKTAYRLVFKRKGRLLFLFSPSNDQRPTTNENDQRNVICKTKKNGVLDVLVLRFKVHFDA